MSRPTVRLGSRDVDAPRISDAELRRMHDWTSVSRPWRDDPNGKYRPDKEHAGASVRELQEGLQRMGFLPNGPIDGVFGYRTQSATRLFQEYVRAGEGRPEIGTPDAIVGKNTWAHFDRWQNAGLIATWAQPGFEPTATAKRARRLLESALDVLATTGRDALVDALDAWPTACASVPSAQWTSDASRIHLVGIRRNATKAATKRANDDLFVLMGGGLTFVFRGSTDPSPHLSRPDEPYIIRGQHRFRFGWHKLTPMTDKPDGNVASIKVYRAFKPAGGVLVIRDRDLDNAVSATDIAGGLEVNHSINIHWSGRGTSNWSAGCQVIGGAKYLGFRDNVIDCTAFASSSYPGLAQKRTRGAYNLLIDAVAVAANTFATDGDELLYTLLYEEDLNITDGLSAKEFRELVQMLK